ncbi:Bax inhibitor-1/YccA family protein [Streptomyces sp. NPDC051362]|uniref:Bax inhibitor-1/YccA family membrane protein n=1 Tax=Streptomyces sp. NPDC051362 TaxID=3365651 RepID=UPI0037AB608A
MLHVERPALKSSNPVLLSRGFTRRGGSKTAATDPLVPVTVGRHPFGAGQVAEATGGPELTAMPHFVAGLMTMSGVLARASLTFGLTALMAVLSWTVSPVPPTSLGTSYGVAGGAAVVTAVLVFVQRRSRPSPSMALLHAAFQGVFLGMLSNTASTQVAPGVFVQLVLGTMSAFAGVLMAYRLRWIGVVQRWYGFVCAGTLGLLPLTMADIALSPVLGAERLGFHSVTIGCLLGATGVGMATSFLALHFKQVEDGITHGARQQESWAAAFGLTLTLVWLYVEAMRLAALVPAEDDNF